MRGVQRNPFWLPLLGLSLLAAGCGQVGLYSNVPEKEANEMIAILHEHDIACKKQSGDDGDWNHSRASNKSVADRIHGDDDDRYHGRHLYRNWDYLLFPDSWH